jgi:hypothetical protein
VFKGTPRWCIWRRYDRSQHVPHDGRSVRLSPNGR